jgi:hypothetical protein
MGRKPKLDAKDRINARDPGHRTASARRDLMDRIVLADLPLEHKKTSRQRLGPVSGPDDSL